MKKIFIFTAVLSMIIGCNEESLVESDTNIFVISAFLYQGEQVNNVQITSTLPLGSADSTAPPINDAVVILIKEGNRFLLTQTFDKPGYYHYEGSVLTVHSGDLLRIEVTYDGVIAYGETIVPDKPENISLSADTLRIPEFTLGGGFSNSDDNSILLNWDNSDASYYYVVTEPLELNPELIFEDMPSRPARKFISTPSKTAEFSINPRSVSYFGNHRVILYKVNQEYADLYESRQQDSRNLQEPLTNIVNALGVFSAFASDTLYFSVIPE